MAQWQCNLKVSLRTQLFSLFVHGILVFLVLTARWPASYVALQLALLVLILLEYVRSQKNITSRQGEIKLKDSHLLVWKNQEWRIVKPPWTVQSGVLFSLQRLQDNSRQQFWLASDNMAPGEWRHLRQVLKQSLDFSLKDK